MKPRFGIDIDGTVTCPATLIPHINKQYNIQMTLDDIVEYDFLSGFPHPVDRSEFQRWFKEHEPEMYKVSETAKYAQQVLRAWQECYELYYISARAKNVEAITYDWFNEQQIPYHHIELIGSHDKIDIAKLHQVDAFFEDKHDNAVMLAEQLKIPVVLFNTPYNQKPVPSNVVRVNDWLEAQRFIAKIF